METLPPVHSRGWSGSHRERGFFEMCANLNPLYYSPLANPLLEHLVNKRNAPENGVKAGVRR